MNTQSRKNYLHQQLAWATQNIIDAICGIKEVPEGLLPHTVFVEEVNETGEPCYGKYQLTDIDPVEKNCIIYDKETGYREEIALEAINTDWLIAVWNRYAELSGEEKPGAGQAIPNPLERPLRLLLDVALHEIPCFEQSHTFAVCTDALGDDGPAAENGDARIPPVKELSAFLYPLKYFGRNVPDDEILSGWAGGCVEKYTPDEFAELVNDESFAGQEYWVRFIEC